MFSKPGPEHHWLDQLVGEWTFETECQAGPDQPPMRSTGTEVVRSIGGLWTVGEGQTSAECGPCTTIMTLGFDPESGRYVGTFIANIMAQMWHYQGSLDAAGKVLTLDTEGPDFAGGGRTKYKDIIEIVTPEHRTLSSVILGADGEWRPFMTGHYRRKV